MEKLSVKIGIGFCLMSFMANSAFAMTSSKPNYEQKYGIKVFGTPQGASTQPTTMSPQTQNIVKGTLGVGVGSAGLFSGLGYAGLLGSAAGFSALTASSFGVGGAVGLAGYGLYLAGKKIYKDFYQTRLMGLTIREKILIKNELSKGLNQGMTPDPILVALAEREALRLNLDAVCSSMGSPGIDLDATVFDERGTDGIDPFKKTGDLLHAYSPITQKVQGFPFVKGYTHTLVRRLACLPASHPTDITQILQAIANAKSQYTPPSIGQHTSILSSQSPLTALQQNSAMRPLVQQPVYSTQQSVQSATALQYQPSLPSQSPYKLY